MRDLGQSMADYFLEKFAAIKESTPAYKWYLVVLGDLK